MNEKRMKSAAKQAVHYRNYRRARDRALTRLATAYPEHYKELLEQEKANDEQQGKKWIDLNGPGSTADLDIRANATASVAAQAGNAGEDAGNRGGKA